MNTNYLGNGELFAMLDEQNIQYLCRYGEPSFVGLSASLSLVTKRENGICHSHSPTTAGYDGRIDLYDLIYEGCLIRYIETTKPFDLQLIFPAYTHRYWMQDARCAPHLMVTIPTGTQTGDGSCSTKESRMLISVTGDAVLMPQENTIRVHPGRSAVLFVTAKTPELSSALQRYLQSLDGSGFFQSVPYRTAKAALYHPLAMLCAKEGGVLSGHGEHLLITSDMAAVGISLLVTKQTERAFSLAEFLLKAYRQYGFIPLQLHARHIASAVEPCERETANYPALCLFFHLLLQHSVPKQLEKQLIKCIPELLSCAIKDSVCGQIGFSGNEFTIRKSLISPANLLHGNALGSAILLYLSTKYTVRGSAEYQEACAGYLQKDFPIHRMRIDSANRVGRYRLPPMVYGSCPACGEHPYIGWLTRTDYGSYLCPHCQSQKRAVVYPRDEAPLPGHYALYRYFLYLAGQIEYSALCMDLVTCTERLDTTDCSLYDASLLCFALKKTALPQYKKLSLWLAEQKTKQRAPLMAAEIAAFLLAQNE